MTPKPPPFNDEGLAFLSAIHNQPKDNTIRLIFADWLDERDQAELASFMRLDIQRHTSQDVSTDKLHAKLANRLKRMYVDPLPSGTRFLGWNRGLPLLEAKRSRRKTYWRDQLIDMNFISTKVLPAITPLARLRIALGGYRLSGLITALSSPAMGRVSELLVMNDTGGRSVLVPRVPLPDDHFELLSGLAASPYLAHLNSVTLLNGFTRNSRVLENIDRLLRPHTQVHLDKRFWRLNANMGEDEDLVEMGQEAF